MGLESGLVDVGFKIVFETVVAGHFVALAAFFVEPYSCASALDVNVNE